MPDRVEFPLCTSDGREELALMARLIIAANGSRSPLGQREIDEILDAQAWT